MSDPRERLAEIFTSKADDMHRQMMEDYNRYPAAGPNMAVAAAIDVYRECAEIARGMEDEPDPDADDEPPRPIEGRLYFYQKDCCRFISSGSVAIFGKPTDYDFYYCPSSGSVLARYGHEGSEYTSFGEGFYYQESIINLTPVYTEAYRRAVEAGYIVESKP